MKTFYLGGWGAARFLLDLTLIKLSRDPEIMEQTLLIFNSDKNKFSSKMDDLILKPVVFILFGEPGVDIGSKKSTYF